MRGGMGEVWLAYDKDLGRRVVLKRAMAGDGSATAFDRLRAEARALAQFSHPHVVTLYDAVRAGKRGRTTSWHQDACSLLAPSALEVVPGVDVDDPDIGFGGWDCEWGSSTRKLAVDLSFDRGQPPTAEDGTPTRLGGYRAFVQPEGDGERTCLARVVYRSYPDQNGQKAVEMLHLVVAGESSADQLCTMAQRLARSAADALRTV
ncbi:hypothetical protein [Streptomyces sp. NPDC005336]|uniref:hypothetical protein n=1 Tax=Streptomyces sp. NPDC005336 TaxID=3157035 RepID=UPI0033B00ED6